MTVAFNLVLKDKLVIHVRRGYNILTEAEDAFHLWTYNGNLVPFSFPWIGNRFL